MFKAIQRYSLSQYHSSKPPLWSQPRHAQASPSPLTALPSQEQTGMSQLTYLQKSSSHELPGPPAPQSPQSTPSLPRRRAFLLHTPHQQGSEISRLLQVHLKGAQPHFSCVHRFHSLPPGAQPFGYQDFNQFSGLLLPLSQHTHSLYEHLNQTPLQQHTGSIHPL